MTKTLSHEQVMRFNRQIVLPQVDLDGQEALLNAKVIIIGMGGLGNAAALSLCASGVGELTLIDFDTVDKTNLPRQPLYTEGDVGKNKVDVATRRLHQVNPLCNVKAISHTLSDSHASLIENADVVLDCTDNADARDKLNALCFRLSTPLVSGAAIRFEGQLFVAIPGESSCYGCLRRLFSAPELSCVEAGIFSPVVNIIGTYQALLAMQVIMKCGDIPLNTLLTFDGLRHEWQNWKLADNTVCDVCSPPKTRD